jgi:hypothetical protein
MSLNTFKAAVRTVYANPDYELISSGVRHMQASGLSECEIFRAALAVSPELDRGHWQDLVKTAFEKHPAKNLTQ